MPLRRSLLSLVIILLMGGAHTLAPAHAQESEGMCPVLVETALAAVGDNCGGLGRNNACYGFDQVAATFSTSVAEDFFSHPSDRAELTGLQTLQTAPLDESNETWGIALMNVQANVPNTLPGQGVVFMLMGDTVVENAVAADEAFIPAEPVSVTTLAAAANIRNVPGLDSFVLGSVPAGTPLEADGRSADGEWLRVIFDDTPAWINRAVLDRAVGLDALPVINPDNQTPMQAFFFSTGTGTPVCNEAPDSLLIQGPENFTVNINANGADIAIGSTIIMLTDEEDIMRVMSIAGEARVEGIVIPAGFSIDAELDAEGQIVPGRLVGFRPISAEELERLQTVQNIRADLLNYRFELPTRAQIIALQQAIRSREAALSACRDTGFTQEQCQIILGNDDNLVARLQRCLAAGFTETQCLRVIASGINPLVVQRCLEQGLTTEAQCRAAFEEQLSSELQQFCESAGFTSEEACRAALEENATALQQACLERGFTSLEACRAALAGSLTTFQRECLERGFTSEEECRAALEAAAGSNAGDDGGGSASSPPTFQEFCQSKGFNSMAQCGAWCNSQGYSSPAECMAGG